MSEGGWRGGSLSSPEKVSKFLSKPMTTELWIGGVTGCQRVGGGGERGGERTYHTSRKNEIEY